MRATVQFDLDDDLGGPADDLARYIEAVMAMFGTLYGPVVGPVRVSIDPGEPQHFEQGQMVPIVEGTGKEAGTVTVASVDWSGGQVTHEPVDASWGNVAQSSGGSGWTQGE